MEIEFHSQLNFNMYWTFSGLLLLHFINLVIADDQKLEGKHLTVAVGDVSSTHNNKNI